MFPFFALHKQKEMTPISTLIETEAITLILTSV